MKVTRWSALGALVIGWMLSGQAEANSMSWTFQSIDSQPSGPDGHVGLAMRTGATWPTAFYDGSQSGGGSLSNALVASSLTPVGWLPSGLGSITSPPTYMRTAPGHDGRVGVVWQDQSSVRFAQSGGLGWQFTSPGSTPSSGASYAPDLDYLSGDRPLVAYKASAGITVAAYDGLTWNADLVDPGGIPASGERVAVAVGSQDQIAVAYREGPFVRLALKSPLWGDWTSTQVVPGSPDHLSLAMSPNDEPVIAMISAGTLTVASYDTQSGQWQTDTLGGLDSQRVNVEFNSLGHPALAYAAGGEVHYRVNDGGGWADYVLPTTDPQLNVLPQGPTDAALAFDGDDVPLIAYYANDGIILAYDPVFAPEPTSLVLLAIGWGMIRRRRRRT